MVCLEEALYPDYMTQKHDPSCPRDRSAVTAVIAGRCSPTTAVSTGDIYVATA